MIAQLSPDIVHTNGFKMHVLGAFAKTKGSALVWHIHDYVRTLRPPPTPHNPSLAT